jgi:hypothetical protein
LLKLIANLKGDRSVIVCRALWNVFSTIDRLEPERDRPGFRTFARSVLRPAFDAVGWIPQKGEPEDTVRLRSDLIWYLCELGDQEIQREGCEQFENFLRNPATVDPNLRLAVFCCVGAAGSDAQYQKLKELAMRSNNPGEVQNAVAGLAATSDPERATGVLTWAFEGNLPASDAINVAYFSAHLSLNPTIAWSFLKSHGKEILRIMPLSEQSNFVDYIAQNLSDPKDAGEVREFARIALPPGAQVKIEETAQKILHWSSLKERVIPKMDVWIKANSETAAKR